MQFATFRALAPESAAQEIGEVVVTVPEPLFVQPQDEEVLPVQPLQHVVPVGAAGEASHKEPVRLLRIEVSAEIPAT